MEVFSSFLPLHFPIAQTNARLSFILFDPGLVSGGEGKVRVDSVVSERAVTQHQLVGVF